jgi:hypothetical protein
MVRTGEKSLYKQAYGNKSVRLALEGELAFG